MTVEESPCGPMPSATAGGCSRPRRRLFRERGLDVGVGRDRRGGRRRPRHAVPQLRLQGGPDRGDRRRADARGGGAGGEELLDAPTIPARRCSSSSAELVGRQQLDRALFEAIDDAWLARGRDPRRPRRGRRRARAAARPRAGRRSRSAGRRRDGRADDVQGRVRGRGAYAHVDPAIDRPPARPDPGERHARTRGAAAAGTRARSRTWSSDD